MPFYEYQCQGCGAHHEALQKMSDPPLRKCPACGKAKLARLMSAPAFRLKGGGWYETDFKSDQDRKRNLHGDDAVTPPAVVSDKSAKTDATPKAPDSGKTEPAKVESAKPAASGTQKPTAASSRRSTASKTVSKGKQPAAKAAKGR